MKTLLRLFFLWTVISLMSCKQKEITVKFLNENCIDYGKCCNPNNFDDCVIGNLVIGHVTVFNNENQKISEIDHGVTYLTLKPGTYTIKFDYKVIMKDGRECSQLNGTSWKKVIVISWLKKDEKSEIMVPYKFESWEMLFDQTEGKYLLKIDDKYNDCTVNMCDGTYKTPSDTAWVPMTN